MTTIVSNAASSGKVLKINSLVAAGVGDTTGITVDIYDQLQLVQQIQFRLHHDSVLHIFICCYYW